MDSVMGIIRSWRARLFIAAVLALPFSACENPESAGVSQPSGKEVAAGTSMIEPLVILTYDEYFSPAVISGFEKEHGSAVELVTFSNMDEMKALLVSRPSDFDLVITDGGTLADLIDLRLLQPIDRTLLPRFDNLDSQFLNLKFDPENQYSIPYMWGTTLIAYRADKIPDPEKSWKALWDKRYSDRVLMVDDGFDIYAAALQAAGHGLNSEDPAQLEAATRMLVKQVEDLRVRFVDIYKIREKLLSGDCWISMSYSSDAAVLAEAEENIAYFIPEEGAPLWLDSFAIPRESRRTGAAHLFLDYLCRAEVAAANSNELFCASANRAAKPFLSKEILEDGTLYLDPAILSRCHFDTQSNPARQLAVNQGLKRVYDRVREIEAKPRLSLLIWEEYLAPDVIERFEKECGATVIVTEVENSEQLKQELGSKPDAYDVVVADEKTLQELIELRFLSELASKELSAESPYEPFLNSAADPRNRYSAPYLWGLTVLAGRSDRLKGVEPSWNLIWREDLKIALLDEPQDLMWIALLSLGYDPARATREQVDEASVKLAQRFPDFSGIMMDMISALDALEAGEMDLVMTYNGDAIKRAAAVPGIEVIVPQEGAPLWLDSFAISRDAPNPSLATRFINFMTTSEVSALTASKLNYATPNLEARAMVSPLLQAEPALYPKPELSAKCRFVEFPAEIQQYVNQSMLRLISESRSRLTTAQSLTPGRTAPKESSTGD